MTWEKSKEPFTIPPNVYVLGTMNTADRSIKLLDAALRRRFAFIELMPDSEVLRGGKVANLPLDDFLDALNRRVAAREGREKQIGHAFLLDGDNPVSEPEEFGRRFRQEILPLLQEYCYDDYSLLAQYIGEDLVDAQMQTLRHDRLGDADQLIEDLEKLLENGGQGQADHTHALPPAVPTDRARTGASPCPSRPSARRRSLLSAGVNGNGGHRVREVLIAVIAAIRVSRSRHDPPRGPAGRFPLPRSLPEARNLRANRVPHAGAQPFQSNLFIKQQHERTGGGLRRK